jgi:hypothetical protein
LRSPAVTAHNGSATHAMTSAPASRIEPTRARHDLPNHLKRQERRTDVSSRSHVTTHHSRSRTRPPTTRRTVAPHGQQTPPAPPSTRSDGYRSARDTDGLTERRCGPFVARMPRPQPTGRAIAFLTKRVGRTRHARTADPVRW